MKKIIPLLFVFFIQCYLPVHAQSWSIFGNSGTSRTTNFIGTTDNNALVFRMNNIFSGTIDSVSRLTYFGYCAGRSTAYQSSENTGIGYFALNANTSGNLNTAVGSRSMIYNTSGMGNTALGLLSLYANTTGSYNTGVGYLSVANGAGAGAYNTGVGCNALVSPGNSQYNTALGYNSASGPYAVGWNNTFLGANTRATGVSGYYNVIAIGQDVACTAVNQVMIGNTATYQIGGYQDWHRFSDGRYKKDVKENVPGLEFILKLRPVTYHVDIAGINKKLGRPKDLNGKEIPVDDNMQKSYAQRERELATGFIAQEVEAVAQKIGYDFEGVTKPGNENDFYGIRYAEFVVPLVKAVQEQQEQIADLKKEIELLKEQNKLLQGVTKNN